jgi:hypothetical protein
LISRRAHGLPGLREHTQAGSARSAIAAQAINSSGAGWITV